MNIYVAHKVLEYPENIFKFSIFYDLLNPQSTQTTLSIFHDNEESGESLCCRLRWRVLLRVAAPRDSCPIISISLMKPIGLSRDAHDIVDNKFSFPFSLSFLPFFIQLIIVINYYF